MSAVVTSTGRRVRRPLPAVLLAALLAAACGAATGPPLPTGLGSQSGVTARPGAATSDPGASTTTSPGGHGTGVGPWVTEVPEDHPHVLEGVAADPAEAPVGNSLGDLANPSGPPSGGLPDPVAGTTRVNPCDLVSAGEWAAWTERALGDAAGLPPVVLEDGDACGWIGPGDRVRMAIAAFRAAGAARWLDPASAVGEPVAGLGDSAVWLRGWPIASSSTLIVQIRDHDLVLEMSSLDAVDPLLLDGARELAAIAVERLP